MNNDNILGLLTVLCWSTFKVTVWTRITKTQTADKVMTSGNSLLPRRNQWKRETTGSQTMALISFLKSYTVGDGDNY